MHAVLVAVVALLTQGEPPGYPEDPNAAVRADGYRGIWYANQATEDEYVYKYSGGLGTYCAKHIPMAVYAEEVNKTFFVYGGARDDGKSLLEMVSFYDHATGEVPRPVVLMDKETTDAHDNPVLSIDDAGHLWVFASAHGTARPAFIFRSDQPYSIEGFTQMHEFNYSYPQPWYVPGKGFLFLHTRYKGGRGLYWMTSSDGATWSEAKKLAHIDAGHYQVSWRRGDTVGTAFNHHPGGKGLNFRTNLYYMQTTDMGATWTNVQGEAIETPVTTAENVALVYDYASERRLVYMKDINFDAEGHPAILHVTSSGWEPGPENGPREWRVAKWTGAAWTLHTVTTSDNNYDTGSLYIESDGTWRIIGPTDAGPQPYNPGGELAIWVSNDAGETWRQQSTLTENSPRNHTYARRPVNAHPGFYTYWADGHGRQASESRLYFYDSERGAVVSLPPKMSGATARVVSR
jgi:hypothetical protein